MPFQRAFSDSYLTPQASCMPGSPNASPPAKPAPLSHVSGLFFPAQPTHVLIAARSTAASTTDGDTIPETPSGQLLAQLPSLVTRHRCVADADHPHSPIDDFDPVSSTDTASTAEEIRSSPSPRAAPATTRRRSSGVSSTFSLSAAESQSSLSEGPNGVTTPTSAGGTRSLCHLQTLATVGSNESLPDLTELSGFVGPTSPLTPCAPSRPRKHATWVYAMLNNDLPSLQAAFRDSREDADSEVFAEWIAWQPGTYTVVEAANRWVAPLLLAVRWCCPKVVQALLELGASPFAVNHLGQNALTVLCAQPVCDARYLLALQPFFAPAQFTLGGASAHWLDAPATADSPGGLRDLLDRNAELLAFLEFRNLEMVLLAKLLLLHGVDPSRRDVFGYSALDYADLFNHSAIVETIRAFAKRSRSVRSGPRGLQRRKSRLALLKRATIAGGISRGSFIDSPLARSPVGNMAYRSPTRRTTSIAAHSKETEKESVSTPRMTTSIPSDNVVTPIKTAALRVFDTPAGVPLTGEAAWSLPTCVSHSRLAKCRGASSPASRLKGKASQSESETQHDASPQRSTVVEI